MVGSIIGSLANQIVFQCVEVRVPKKINDVDCLSDKISSKEGNSYQYDENIISGIFLYIMKRQWKNCIEKELRVELN